MRITGSNTMPFPVAAVWDALLDPEVLVNTIPGCVRLETTAEHTYAMTVTAGVAAIKGTYAGSCALSALDPHQSLVMRLNGAGTPGTIDATVDVTFRAVDEGGGTEVSYAADAVVGGMVGGVGQRMLTSVSKRMADEFFGNVGREISDAATPVVPAVPDAGPAPAPVGQVFTAPDRTPSNLASSDFVRGIAVGAGLVLAGAIVGAIFGRRR
jgi:carbon monoxide dehydrogenase subunit G